MPKLWSKVWRDASQSERLADLFDKNIMASALFWPLKAHADDFGRCTANPRKFAYVVGGLAGISAADAKQVIDDMEECGVIRRYEVDGEQYLELCDYATHEEPSWSNVSTLEYPAPTDWTPPEALADFLRSNIHQRNVTTKRYGIVPGINAACDALLVELGEMEPEQASKQGSEPPLNTPATPVEHPANTLSIPVEHPANGSEHGATDVDVDKDKDKDTTTLPDGALCAVQSEPQCKAPERISYASREHDAKQQCETMLSAMPDRARALAEQFIAVAAAENKSGKLTHHRALTLLQEVQELMNEHDGGEAFYYGMAEAIKREVPNIRYVAKCVDGYKGQATYQPAADYAAVNVNEFGEVV